jgi:putative intracellular protease/amidase
MARIGTIDPNAVKPAEDFTIIPPGEYQALIVASDVKPTNKRDGHYLEITYQILGGEFANRKLWSRHNLDNKSQKTVEIAEREVSAICHAVGYLQKLEDSVVLHNKPMVIRVEVEAADATKGRNKDQNVIKAWKPIGDGAVVATPAAATPAPGKSPWGQRAA